MPFLYRLAAAAFCSMAITGFSLVVLRQPVAPEQFYGGIAWGVTLSYAHTLFFGGR